jgi:hypothetical protein
MTQKRFQLLVGLVFLFIVMSACGSSPAQPPSNPPPQPPPTPTPDISFQISRYKSNVYYGSGAALSLLGSSLPQPFPLGYKTNTDQSGIALLEGQAQAGKCKIYVFRDTSLTQSACVPGTFNASNSSCVEAGSALYNKCTGHIVITASGVAQHKFTALSATYLPDSQITLFIALEGALEVTPLNTLNEYNPDLNTIQLEQGNFLYTAPDDHMQGIAGLTMREPHPISEIRPLVDALDLWKWIDQLQPAIDQEDLGVQVVPTAEPAYAADVIINMAGGPFNQPAGREAVMHAAPWLDILQRLVDGQNVRVTGQWTEPGNELDGANYPFNLDLAQKLLSSVDYSSGFGVQMFVPAGDDQLIALAQEAARSMGQVGMDTSVIPATDVDLKSQVDVNLAAGYIVIWLQRR